MIINCLQYSTRFAKPMASISRVMHSAKYLNRVQSDVDYNTDNIVCITDKSEHKVAIFAIVHGTCFTGFYVFPEYGKSDKEVKHWIKELLFRFAKPGDVVKIDNELGSAQYLMEGTDFCQVGYDDVRNVFTFKYDEGIIQYSDQEIII